MRQIQQTGFTPCGYLAEQAISTGNPVRSTAIVVLILLYCGFLYATFHPQFALESALEKRNYIPGNTELMSLSALLFSLLVIYCFPFIQKLIVKPRRNFKEIKYVFTFLVQLIGIFLAVFATQFIRQESLHNNFGVPQLVGLIGFSSIFLLPVARAFCLGGKLNI